MEKQKNCEGICCGCMFPCEDGCKCTPNAKGYEGRPCFGNDTPPPQTKSSEVKGDD